jgi:hypothetical protein
MNDNNLIYLYCVTDKEPSLNKAFDLVGNLYCLNLNEMYAILSEVSKDDFDKDNLEKNIGNMEWLEKHVRIHESVIDAVMTEKELALVPFKFATVFYNRDSLKSFVDEYSESLKENLHYLSDKEEWGVKIFFDNKRLEKSILENDSDVNKIDEEISSSTPGKAFFLKKKKKELVKSLLKNRTSEYGKDCFKNLKNLSAQTKINKLQQKELTGKKTDMILNAVFLINTDNIPKFMDCVLELRSKYENKGFEIDCSGPWPAYNFIIMETAKNT